MSALLRNGLYKAAPLLKTNVIQKGTLVSGPPRVRISFAEKSILGSIMILGVIGPSAYLLANIPYYREKGNKEQ